MQINDEKSLSDSVSDEQDSSGTSLERKLPKRSKKKKAAKQRDNSEVGEEIKI